MIALFGTVLAACGDEASAPRRPIPADAKSVVGGREGAVPVVAPPSEALMADQSGPGVGATLPTRAADSTVANNMIIRTGTASVLVDSLEAAIARVTSLAATLGGFVANTQIQTGEAQVRSATLELKIPTARFQQVTDGLTPLGKVESVNVGAEDVGEEFVDVNARVANSRRLEDRLVQLLAQRTGKLQDVLQVERELARVREEIERYEGRLRFLKTRVAMSTLTITVHEKAPVVSSNPGQNVISEAFVNAWRTFVLFTAGLIAALGWIIPLGVMLVGGGVVARRFARRTASPVAPRQA
ncbi:MAG: DUF4349 domain-containing protein [Gemmatimonadaceae bacterium]